LTGCMHCVIPLRHINSSCLPATEGPQTTTPMLGTTSATATQPTGLRLLCGVMAWAIAWSLLLMLSAGTVSAKPKAQRAPRPEPELKVLELKISPNPYVASAGSLEFSALVQLPRELEGATILEVSSLVTSPSKTSIRFLSLRKPLESPAATPVSTDPPKVAVLLTWDGKDHTKSPAEAGMYHFELRAKLLSNGDKGPRTLMVSWPKRGTLDVR
jgi:hypothetical protein